MEVISLDCIYSSATTSASHIFSNVTKAVESYIERKLPVGLLKGRSISTTIAPRFFKKYRNRNTDWDKQERPFMVIRPTFETPEYDGFLQNTLYTRQEGTEITVTRGGIQEFLADKGNGIAMGFKINHNKLTFDIGIRFNTQMQMIDTWHYMFNTFRWDIPEYVNTSLESMIPKVVLIRLGEVLGIDITKDENIPLMIKYLRTHSTYPITYKMRNSTSQDEYFLFYRQNLIVTFSDLQMDEGQKKGMADDFFTLSFKCVAEFNNMGSYVLIGTRKLYKKLAVQINTDKAIDIGSFTPIFTYDMSGDDPDLLNRGYKPMVTTMIKTEASTHGKDDVADISCFFTNEISNVIANTLAQGLDMGILFQVRLSKGIDNKLTTADFDVDWTNCTVTIHNSDKYATYRLLIYVNLSYLNNRIMELGYGDKTDQQNLNGSSITGYF